MVPVHVGWDGGDRAPGAEPVGRRVIVGLLVDPGPPTDIVEDLIEELPRLLAERVDSGVAWEVLVISQDLPLDQQGNLEVWQHSATLKQEHSCDLMVCLTELTRRVGERFFISDVNVARGVGVISLPALGPFQLHRQLRSALVRVVRTLAREDFAPEREAAALRRTLPGIRTRLDQEEAQGEKGTDSYMALSGAGSSLQLVTGMVRINQPWLLVPSLDAAIAAAVAGSAWGVFYSSIWTMADALSPVRLALVSLLAMSVFTFWLIYHNGLWERRTVRSGSTFVYNASTLLTISTGVLCAYLLLVGFVFVSALTVIPFNYMSSALGHDVSLADYAFLAWFVSSMGTFAGALGSSFESDDAIRRATYGRRERERHAAVRERAGES
jgi:hypothetical protein